MKVKTSETSREAVSASRAVSEMAGTEIRTAFAPIKLSVTSVK